MQDVLIQPFLLGLTVGIFCLTYCVPFIAPYIVAEQRKIKGELTYCPESGEIAIERKAYFIISNNLKNGQCSTGEQIPGIWE